MSRPNIRIFPVSNYALESKEPQQEEDASVHSRLLRLQCDYRKSGIRKSVEGVLMVHVNRHPHILLLRQMTNSFYKLPGDYLQPGEDEVVGLQRRLHKWFGSGNALADDWKVGECVATWWRPNFETSMYPYIPAHVSKPKEQKKLFIVHLPPVRTLKVPNNIKLTAVPLFELYDNRNLYGGILASLPNCLSRFQIHFDE